MTEIKVQISIKLRRKKSNNNTQQLFTLPFKAHAHLATYLSCKNILQLTV